MITIPFLHIPIYPYGEKYEILEEKFGTNIDSFVATAELYVSVK